MRNGRDRRRPTPRRVHDRRHDQRPRQAVNPRRSERLADHAVLVVVSAMIRGRAPIVRLLLRRVITNRNMPAKLSRFRTPFVHKPSHPAEPKARGQQKDETDCRS
jgi:hypothetical protein